MKHLLILLIDAKVFDKYSYLNFKIFQIHLEFNLIWNFHLADAQRKVQACRTPGFSS